MLKKLLVTASVAGLIAGAAQALEVDARATGADAAGEPIVLAAELDYAGGSVASTNELGVTFYPTGGTFPTGNVVAYVTVSGAVFDGALDGTEVVGAGTSVISTGGIDGGTTAAFLLSDASLCAVADDCSITLPLILDGSDVSISVGLETDAGVPIDNTEETKKVTADLVKVAPAFAISFAPDTVENAAQLSTLFTTLTDDYLGDISVFPTEVKIGVNDRTVNTDLAGTDVAWTDVDELNVTLEGTMDAYDPANGGDVEIYGFSADDVDVAADEATIELVAAPAGGFDDYDVVLVPDGSTAIARSKYKATVDLVHGGALAAGTTSASGTLEPVTREGTSILFPWTQSATQGAASGASSVYRIGNLDSDDAGAVFVEVKNASEAGFVNPGITEIASSIDAGGELVVNSSSIEAAVGNYGRGDLEFTIEADATTLSGRQFVVRNGVIQQVIGGNIDQDINN